MGSFPVPGGKFSPRQTDSSRVLLLLYDETNILASKKLIPKPRLF